MRQAQAQTPRPQGPSCAQTRCTGRSREDRHISTPHAYLRNCSLDGRATHGIVRALGDVAFAWSSRARRESSLQRERTGSAQTSADCKQFRRGIPRTCGSNVANGFEVDEDVLVDEAEEVLLAEAVLFPFEEVLFLSSLALAVLFPV